MKSFTLSIIISFSSMPLVQSMEPVQNPKATTIELRYDASDRKGNTLLHKAIDCDDIEIARFLINSCKELVNIPNNNEETPLFYAVYMNSNKLVDLLIENGATVNHENKDENKSIFYYVMRQINKKMFITILKKLAEESDIKSDDLQGYDNAVLKQWNNYLEKKMQDVSSAGKYPLEPENYLKRLKNDLSKSTNVSKVKLL